MRMIMGFRESKILLAANDLDLFTRLDRGVCSVEELSAQMKVDAHALGILMDALTAMGILSKNGATYDNREMTRTYLVKGSPHYQGQFLSFLNYCYRQLSTLEERLMPAGTGKSLPFVSGDESRFARVYAWGMDNVAKERAERIARHLDLADAEKILDLGGGAATYSMAFASMNPRLTAVVLDLPPTLEIARENIKLNGLCHRIRFLAGSYWDLDYGSGYDLVWISQVIHSLDEFQGRELIRRGAEALAPGGRLIVHDSLLAEDRASPYYAAMFSVFMLALTQGGRCHTVNETRDWLIKAGLQDVCHFAFDSESDLLIGRKPG